MVTNILKEHLFQTAFHPDEKMCRNRSAPRVLPRRRGNRQNRGQVSAELCEALAFS